MDKVFNLQQNIGRAKYVVNFHDGRSMHADHSPFFNTRIFSSKKRRDAFLTSLNAQGYTEQVFD